MSGNGQAEAYNKKKILWKQIMSIKLNLYTNIYEYDEKTFKTHC